MVSKYFRSKGKLIMTKHSNSTVNYVDLIEMLEERSSMMPASSAFTFLKNGEHVSIQITYSELERKAKSLAFLLQDRGLTNNKVLLLFSPGIDFIIAYYGCILAGAVAIPAYIPRVNQALTTIEGMVVDAKVDSVLTTSSMYDELSKRMEHSDILRKLNVFNIDEIDISACSLWLRPEHINNQSIAFLQYTSGSTGIPKGVMVSHHNLLHNTAILRQLFNLHMNDNLVSWLPVFHDMGLIANVVLGIEAGCHCVLMAPLDFLKKPFRWLKAISDFKAKVSGGPNFAYELCVNRINESQVSQLDLSSWYRAYNGAEPIRASTLRRFQTTFSRCGFSAKSWFPCYGMAEGTLIVSGAGGDQEPKCLKVSSILLEENKVQIVDSDSKYKELASCGQVVSGQQVVIVDPNNFSICDENEVGEIWLKGQSVALGYFDRSSLTKEAFGALTNDGKGPYYRTGDLGFKCHGDLYITGRLKDMIIIRGSNHYPQDIEQTVEMSDLDHLRSGTGIAFSIEIDDMERLVVIQGLDKNISDMDMLESITKKIVHDISAQHGVEVYDVVLVKPGFIPKTTSGKLKRRECREKYLSGRLDRLN